MTPEMLATICAAAISLAASYLPGFSGWFERLDGTQKRLLILGLLAAAAAGSYAAACAGLAGALGIALTCDQPGLIALVRTFLAALISSQAVYTISPQSTWTGPQSTWTGPQSTMAGPQKTKTGL